MSISYRLERTRVNSNQFFNGHCLETSLKDCLVGNLSGNGSCTVNGRNMRSDFGLLCENYYLGAFIMSIPPGAHFFGAFISGPISDYLGRRIAMILSIIGLTTFSGMVTKPFCFSLFLLHLFNCLVTVCRHVCFYLEWNIICCLFHSSAHFSSHGLCCGVGLCDRNSRSRYEAFINRT